MHRRKIRQYLDEVSAEYISPPHEPRNNALLDELKHSMSQRGWYGRPLLVLKRKDGTYQAITGSHRLAAASSLGLDVPVYVLEPPEFGWDRKGDREQLIWESLELAVDNADAMSSLMKIGDGSAIQLMREEEALR